MRAHVIRCVTLITFLLRCREVTSGERYEYEVSVRGGGDGGVSSLPSPRLTYTHGASFCGDGRVDSGGTEQCDDGNLRDGDGCSLECRIERFFHCIGTRRAGSAFFFSKKKSMTSLFV